MNSLSALLLVAAIAYSIASPPDPTSGAGEAGRQPDAEGIGLNVNQMNRGQYILPHLLLPYHLRENRPPIPFIPPQRRSHDEDWLSKEIERITQMDSDYEPINHYDTEDPYMHKMLDMPRYIPHMRFQESNPRPPSDLPSGYPIPIPWLERAKEANNRDASAIQPEPETHEHKTTSPPAPTQKYRKPFALTPLDKGYFEPDVKLPNTNNMTKEELETAMALEPPRKTRQNPNLSRTKTLVAENLDRLRTGLANKDYRLPVSLLPANLEFLKINRLDDDEERSHEEEATDRPRHIHVVESADPAQSIYGVAIIAAVGAALTMAIVGFAFGWYTLSKKAKAAADVDYPAYGVTGPNFDTSGDRKLAHSAHMYHYQHQKQQIIAMERNGLEQRAGSISEPESEEENEEGDYTVYECPGFATTGDMEVKNPLFSDEPTPATPGKCEIVKPQPKE